MSNAETVCKRKGTTVWTPTEEMMRRRVSKHVSRARPHEEKIMSS